jgi:predicted helicase
MTVGDILNEIQDFSQSEREKGALFERLVARVLQDTPLYNNTLERIWFWEDWPYRWGIDAGIDLVAKERDRDEYWAIQCKFFAPEHSIQKPEIDSFFTESGKQFNTEDGRKQFSNRLIVSTTDKWSQNAENALQNQSIPVSRLFFKDLQHSGIDWDEFSLENVEDLRLRGKKELHQHQRDAINRTKAGLKEEDRGKVIMACGTGKTFASLRLVEEIVPKGGTVLFLAPSISLVGQTLQEWAAEAKHPLRAFAVCSDTGVDKKKDNEDIRLHDLAIPATTDEESLAKGVAKVRDDRTKVVFSTYQSIDVVSKAQWLGLPEFDLIVCDEAHRTTGLTLPTEDPSYFVMVHDNERVRGKKRVYMTATPRIFGDVSKDKAEKHEAAIYSMDDESTYGPELYRLTFGEAVERNLLTDYKVLIVAVHENTMASLANAYNNAYKLDDKKGINIDFATKIIGSWKGLSKHDLVAINEQGDEEPIEENASPMQRAVAFSKSIKASRETVSSFEALGQLYQQKTGNAGGNGFVPCNLQHVDGSMNALQRYQALEWLRESSEDEQCRILSNARCLTEGVDVPALDAVIFFDTRESIVDIVQSVGRVMRKSPGKEYGYIVLPVCIPASQVQNYNTFIDNDDQFKGIWKVIKALRAHDESLVDEAEFRRKVNIVGRNERHGRDDDGNDVQIELDFPALPIGQLSDAVYAAIPRKLGDREYWREWAKDVAKIADRVIARIEDAITNKDAKAAFRDFLSALRENISPAVQEREAIEMLTQHTITRPVFEALFEEGASEEANPVSHAMTNALQALDEYMVSEETGKLSRFYSSVHERVKYAKSEHSRQELIRNLYETFFKTAFPQMADRLGIVYTPVEVVDFINHSADQILRRHFGRGLSDENVHIIDPFVGTGTFLVRLLQSDLIRQEDLKRKYEHELHANEIVLLAYYIAAVNIESAYQERSRSFGSFPGIVLTDTFQMSEGSAGKDWVREEEWLAENSNRAKRQRNVDIQVVLGNPPYSAWQASGHESQANQAYPELDERIRTTYAQRSSAQSKNSLYDSYVRAIRWASDRIVKQGIVAFVTNGKFLDGNAAAGIRLSIGIEFSHIYVVNLRGNQRTSGELSRREGGKVFGEGSRAPVAITLLVKDPTHIGKCEVQYYDVGDYLSREEKLSRLVDFGDVTNVPVSRIEPNSKGEWLNQSDPVFDHFPAAASRENTAEATVFSTYSPGVKSHRDAWVYNFSSDQLTDNVRFMIQNYNKEVEKLESVRGRPSVADARRMLDMTPSRIGWDEDLLKRASNLEFAQFTPGAIAASQYRPFAKQWYYFAQNFNARRYHIPQMFPTPKHTNTIIVVTGPGASRPFSALVTDMVPNLHLIDSSQCFPLYRYERNEAQQNDARTAQWKDDEMFAAEQSPEYSKHAADREAEYVRHDAITDWALEAYRAHYGDTSISKEHIFWYVYGLLHSTEYRSRFRNNLRRGLARIPFVRDFWGFCKAGRELGHWHLNYESVEPYPLTEDSKTNMKPEDYRVEKMKFAGKKQKADKTTIVYNSHLTLRGIPLDAFKYEVNGKSAIEWIMERYQVTKDKKSGITNDPNEYSDDPRYIVDLIKRIVRVSLETNRIVAELPPLQIEDYAPNEARDGESTS